MVDVVDLFKLSPIPDFFGRLLWIHLFNCKLSEIRDGDLLCEMQDPSALHELRLAYKFTDFWKYELQEQVFLHL